MRKAAFMASLTPYSEILFTRCINHPPCLARKHGGLFQSRKNRKLTFFMLAKTTYDKAWKRMYRTKNLSGKLSIGRICDLVNFGKLENLLFSHTNADNIYLSSTLRRTMKFNILQEISLFEYIVKIFGSVKPWDWGQMQRSVLFNRALLKSLEKSNSIRNNAASDMAIIYTILQVQAVKPCTRFQIIVQ